MPRPHALGPRGIRAAHHGVGAVKEALLHGLLIGEHIGRIASVGVGALTGDHAAHLERRVDLVRCLHGKRRGNHLVMRLGDTHRVLGVEHHEHVDLVEGDPFVDEPLVLGKAGLGKGDELVDHRAVVPTAIGLLKVDGLVVLVEGDDGVHTQTARLGKNLAVELHALLVDAACHTIRVDARPTDGGVKGGEAHLGEERQVLPPVVVVVGSVVIGIAHVVEKLIARTFGQAIELAHHAARAVGGAIVDGTMPDTRVRPGEVDLHGALAALVPAALYLRGTDRAAPQKALGKRHWIVLSSAPGGTERICSL